jgi:hypothetical protein
MSKEKWTADINLAEGRLRRYFGVKEGEKIPPDKIDAEISRLHAKTQAEGGKGLTEQEQSLLSALYLAKRMRSFSHAHKKGK